MKNNKGIAGQLLIFVIVVAIAAGFVYFIYKSGNQIAAEAYFNDDLSSISLIANAVVNSPSCLLYTEAYTPAKGSPFFLFNRWVIDWSKIGDSKKSCVKKGPYIWNAAVEDSTDSSKGEIKSYDTSTCSELGKRSFPVIIKKSGAVHNGKITVSVASKDAIAAFAKSGKEVKITLLNSGTCTSFFTISAKIINETSGSTIPGAEVSCNPSTTASLMPKQSSEIVCSIPDIGVSAYALKAGISPEGMDYYSKEYIVPL